MPSSKTFLSDTLFTHCSPLQIDTELLQPLSDKVHPTFHIQWPCCITSSDDSWCDWSDVWFHCRDRLCNKVVCMVCHVSSQPLSPSQHRGPRCNPSGSFDPRHSACQCPAPTWKLVTVWQVGMDACDPGQIHTLFHPHLSSPTAPFVLNSILRYSISVMDCSLSGVDHHWFWLLCMDTSHPHYLLYIYFLIYLSSPNHNF